MRVLDTKNKVTVSGCFEVQADLSSNTSATVGLRVQADGALVSDVATAALTQIELQVSPSQPPVVRALINNVWTQI